MTFPFLIYANMQVDGTEHQHRQITLLNFLSNFPRL